MNASVCNELFQREARHFTAHGVKAGKSDDVGRVVDDEVHPRRRFERTDVSAHTSDDSALHFVAGKGDDADGVLRRVVRGAALYRRRDDVLRFLDRVFLGFRLYGFRLCRRTALDFVDERVFEFRSGFLFCHAGNSFEFPTHDFLRIVQLLFDGFQPLAVFVDVLLRLFDLRNLLVEGFVLLVEIVLFAVEGALFLHKTVLRPLPFCSAFLGFALEIRAQFVLLFFGFQKSVFADGFRLQPGLFQNPRRFSFCQAYLVLRIQSVCNQPYRRSDGEGCDSNPDDRSGFECGKQ